MRPADSAPAAAPPRPDAGAAPSRPSPVSRAIAVAIVGLLGALTLANPSTSRMHAWPWALVTTALCVAPLAVGLRLFSKNEPLRLPSGYARVLAGGLVLLALASVASSWASPFSGATLARAWPTLGGVALFFALHHWLAAPASGAATANFVARSIAALGAIIAIVSLASWWRAAPDAPWSNRNTWPFGHSNYTGGFVVMVLPWIVLQGWQARGFARAAWGVAACIALLALAGTSSRGAVVALVAMAGGVGLALVIFGRWSARNKLLFASGLAALGAIVVLANPRLRDLVVRRQWSDAANESNRQRSAMLAAGARLGLDRPLLGWGPGSVPLAYPRVRATLDGGVDNVLQLHNTPVQLWATLGGAGVLAALLIAGGATLTVFAALTSGRRSPLTLAASSSAAGYGVFALTDHQLDVPIFAAIGAANLAVLSAAAHEGPGRLPGRAARFIIIGVAAALLIGPTLAGGRDLLARRAYAAALTAMDGGRLDESIRALDRATAFAPHDPFFQHHAAAALLRAGEQTADAARRRELQGQAVARLQGALRTGVHEEFAHFNLGWLQLELGAPRQAAAHFRAAAALVPDKGGVYFGLGLALQQAGQREAAARAFALEWLNDPRSALSPAWEVPALAALQPAIRAELRQLYASLRGTYPTAATAERWTRWWLGDAMEPSELLPAFSQASTVFAEAWPAIRTRAPVASAAPWAQLYGPWRSGGGAAAFARVAGGDGALAAALARRAQRHRDDFRAFLAAGTDDEPALLRTVRRQRIGYGVLALHPDGPPLTDVFVVQENRVTADFAAPLFPPKGWLPGRFLLALLPAEPR